MIKRFIVEFMSETFQTGSPLEKFEHMYGQGKTIYYEEAAGGFFRTRPRKIIFSFHTKDDILKQMAAMQGDFEQSLMIYDEHVGELTILIKAMGETTSQIHQENISLKEKVEALGDQNKLLSAKVGEVEQMMKRLVDSLESSQRAQLKAKHERGEDSMTPCKKVRMDDDQLPVLLPEKHKNDLPEIIIEKNENGLAGRRLVKRK